MGVPICKLYQDDSNIQNQTTIKKPTQTNTYKSNFQSQFEQNDCNEKFQEPAQGETYFEKQNNIGEYFCGGQENEQNNCSYQKRQETFQKFIKKEQLSNGKKAKQNKIFEVLFKQKFDKLFLQVQDKNTLLQNIKLGPPIKYRWSCWKFHLFKQLSQKDIDLYNNLKQMSSQNEEQINKDLQRTFPQEVYFSSNSTSQKNKKCFLQLKRILGSLSIIYSSLGYCQGMNFIVGFMLLVNGGNEQEAFLMFKVLAEQPNFMLMGLYEDNLPFLQFLEFFIYKMIKINLNKIFQHLKIIKVCASYWLPKWIMCLFLCSFPIGQCARLWDFILSNSIFGIGQIVLSLLEFNQNEIIKCRDFGEFLDFFQTIKVEMNIGLIIESSENYEISRAFIAKQSKKFLKKQPQNQYANLYSHFQNSIKFSDCHQQLLKEKIRKVEFQNKEQEKQKKCVFQRQKEFIKIEKNQFEKSSEEIYTSQIMSQQSVEQYNRYFQRNSLKINDQNFLKSSCIHSQCENTINNEQNGIFVQESILSTKPKQIEFSIQN